MSNSQNMMYLPVGTQGGDEPNLLLNLEITRPYDEGEEYDKKLDNLLNKIESFSRIRTKRIHLLVAYYFLGEELKKSIDPKQTWNLFAKERKRKNARCKIVPRHGEGHRTITYS
ncbi:15929_t:CDS:2 [Entrophospora sp. SA101]|nr:15929_t:CDS:2 [Entrophospora sp. SA101]